MKKILSVFGLILLLPLISIISGSCKHTPLIEDSMVQVWVPGNGAGEDTLLSFGVAVGDGNQVLTVLNYERYTPDGTLSVGKPGETKHNAFIQAIDPRTSATLLKIEDTKLPAAVIGEPDALTPESEVIIHGWPGQEFNTLKTKTSLFPGWGVILVEDVEQGPYIALPGAVITDKQDRVVGLVGTLYNAFVIRLGPPDLAAPVINIQNALELLKPDAINQPWSDGPAFSLITTKDSLTGKAPSEPPSAKYNEMTVALKSLLGTMGEPLPASELPVNYKPSIFAPDDVLNGTILSVVYPRHVELRNTGGQVVAEAKWLGIQWGRSEGQPDRVFYGYMEYGNAVVAGGFVLNGDITELEKTVR